MTWAALQLMPARGGVNDVGCPAVDEEEDSRRLASFPSIKDPIFGQSVDSQVLLTTTGHLE